MNDAAKLLDPLTEPSQLFFAYLVMPGIARLGVGFLQFLKHRALAACVFGPYAVKPAVEPFGERPQKGEDRKSTRELQSLMRISYAVFCLKKKKRKHQQTKSR